MALAALIISRQPTEAVYPLGLLPLARLPGGGEGPRDLIDDEGSQQITGLESGFNESQISEGPVRQIFRPERRSP